MDMYELRDRVQALHTLEKRMDNLTGELRKAQDEVAALRYQYEQERGDVDNLERESFSAFLFRLVGKYEDKLEKEQREEIDAKLAYDRAAVQLEGLTREKGELGQRIAGLQAEEKLYQAELDKRRAELERQSHATSVGSSEGEGKFENRDTQRRPHASDANAERYAELENERNGIIAQITEITEAMDAASNANAVALEALDSFKSAQSWATFDAFTRGGFISHMAKYSHIDSAEQNFNRLSAELRRLQRELADVSGIQADELRLTEISATQRMVDFWFDNIFTDLSVRGKIAENREQVEWLIDGIQKVQEALDEKRREREAELAANRQAEEALLVSM